MAVLSIDGFSWIILILGHLFVNVLQHLLAVCHFTVFDLSAGLDRIDMAISLSRHLSGCSRLAHSIDCQCPSELDSRVTVVWYGNHNLFHSTGNSIRLLVYLENSSVLIETIIGIELGIVGEIVDCELDHILTLNIAVGFCTWHFQRCQFWYVAGYWPFEGGRMDANRFKYG